MRPASHESISAQSEYSSVGGETGAVTAELLAGPCVAPSPASPCSGQGHRRTGEDPIQVLGTQVTRDHLGEHVPEVSRADFVASWGIPLPPLPSQDRSPLVSLCPGR